MTFKTRVSAIRSHLPVSRLLILVTFSVAVTWLFVYLHMVDFLIGEGIDPNKVGHGNIASEVFDATTVLFGLLNFFAAGIIPLGILFIRASATRSNVAQIVWAVLIVGLLLLTRAVSR